MKTDAQKALDQLNAWSENTLMETLGIQYSDVGEDYLEATMPVRKMHYQPMGILHGGASAALAESVGSAASGLYLASQDGDQYAVGLELAINHVRSVHEGTVTARAEAIHRGRSTHLWQIVIRDEEKRMVALAKLTMMVLSRQKLSDQ